MLARCIQSNEIVRRYVLSQSLIYPEMAIILNKFVMYALRYVEIVLKNVNEINLTSLINSLRIYEIYLFHSQTTYEIISIPLSILWFKLYFQKIKLLNLYCLDMVISITMRIFRLS